jgi:ABC-2 type transport system ATP-binding protein
MQILEIKQVTKEYKNQKAIDNLSLSLRQGEVVGLVGPNGAGKTTLMKTVVDLIRSYEGEVTVGGLYAKNNPVAYKRQIGSVIETPGFYPYWSGMENLKYFACVSNVHDKGKINEIVDLLGLKDAIHKKVKNYSLGMKQRLGIARALIPSPKLLILDEPTNGLDPDGVNEMRTYISLIAKKRQVGIMIASHALDEIERVCDKVYIIKKGKLIEMIDMNEKDALEKVIVFKTNQIEDIKQVANEYGFKVIYVGKTEVKIVLGNHSISEMVKVFSANQILLQGVVEEKTSLEEKYFKAVGGNQIE